MNQKNSLYSYKSDGVSFVSKLASQMKLLYFPLSGTHSNSIKSSITPSLSGDIKIDKHRFLTKPASREDLRNDLRNFFVSINKKNIISIAQNDSDAESQVEAGQLWHKVIKKDNAAGIEMEVTNFVPVSDDSVELMEVKLTNISKKNMTVTPTSSIPVFGRALNNKHDHEHVTALLHRTQQLPAGVLVEPTMVFNEEEHSESTTTYYVFGADGQGKNPAGSFPTAESFYGESGNAALPEAVVKELSPKILSPKNLNGKEVVAALRFEEVVLKPGECREYYIAFGIALSQAQAKETFEKFDSSRKFNQSLEECKKYWLDKSSSVKFTTGDKGFNSWMQWVSIQPVLRRIFGCSFLPDHDYGKGGKGWRDIWQDLLSLILVEPDHVRSNLVNNFAGVRIDGSNATIVGSSSGEFFADRNGISRVWMDHGLWPLLTMDLYLNQTGDYDILFETSTYFKDYQLSRTFEKDCDWSPEQGDKLKDKKGNAYRGSLLEHMLVQHLIQFFNVGEHNIIRLESADWNDGLDMAFEKGESVAFMSFYGGNLMKLADLLETLRKNKGVEKISLAEELVVLLDTLSQKVCDYDNPDAKRKLLFEKYFSLVEPEISGKQEEVKIQDLIEDLRQKGKWIFEHIRKNEKVDVEASGQKHSWFNGYYDNKGNKVEGQDQGNVRMTLTGQVFPIMSGVAEKEEVEEIVGAVKKFLKDERLSGIRLNTDFKLRNYLDLGRAFSFAYGTKENGAFFSHMTVMYAYALYLRGFAREGYEVLRSIYDMCIDTEQSKIYPGIPEYFDSEGQGMYPYLTGAASWFAMTELTQVFGVRGEEGDLVLSPKLVKEEFSDTGEAQVGCCFAGKRLVIKFINSQKSDFGEYEIKDLLINAKSSVFEKISKVKIKVKRSALECLEDNIVLEVILS